MALSIIATACAAGCQAPELASRNTPSTSGPFAQVGYTGLTPNYIPKTEVPNADITALRSCARGAEQREAATWVGDWFAAVSQVDRCDQDAQAQLTSPSVRQGLVYILDRTTRGDSSSTCQDAAFKVFTHVEETNARLTSWRNSLSITCSFERQKEVVAKREEAFTRSLSDTVSGIGRYKQRSSSQ